MAEADGGIIVFSRFNSSRLPGKVLADIDGRPLLGRVIDRLRRVPGERQLVIATSTDEVDDPIVRFADAEQVSVFRGDAADTVKRGISCAEHYGFSYFARICGDSPFICPELVDSLFQLYESDDLDVATNLFPRTYPPGVSVEIIRLDAIRRLAAETQAPGDREHMTRYFYSHAKEFRIENHASGDDGFAGVHLAVDTHLDLMQARYIAKNATSDVAAMTLAEISAAARDYAAR